MRDVRKRERNLLRNKLLDEPLLAIDIGNTSISYGLFKSGRLIRYWYGNEDTFPKIDKFIGKSGVSNNNYKVIISSVNPEKLKKLTRLAKMDRKRKLLIVGREIFPRILHKYSKISKLGKDRLVNIWGVIRWYKKPVLVIDFGTATTVDFISKRGIYEGGLIIPGIGISWEALQMKTALLPKVGAIHPSTSSGFRATSRDELPLQSIRNNLLIGHDTKSGMRLGLLQGFGAMVDGLIERFRYCYSRNITVVATGGFASRLKPYINESVMVDPYLTLKSLALIYQEWAEGRLKG